MKSRFARLCLTVSAMVLCCHIASGQYYDWGQDPASVKWNRIKTLDGSYIFPRTYDRHAARIVNYMDTVRPYISEGFELGPMKMPVIMHTQNFQSNGLVMLAPKRIELIVTPSQTLYATPWTKQLAIHEYRHSVQYNNLTSGFVKYLNALLGEQGSLLGTILLSYWFLEGDAVLAETQMTDFGRGLQPSFTMQYRAFCYENMKFSRDQYFSGSFRYPMPSQYELGYQIVSYADTKYGLNAWGRVAKDASRQPLMFFTNHFYLDKNHYTTPKKLFHETFDDLWTFWKTLPQVEDSSTPIVPVGKTYTTYSSPIGLPDGSILAFKDDLVRPVGMVSVTPDGKEKVVMRPGSLSSPMSTAGGKVYWAEYRQSTFWAQRVNSQLCWFDPTTGKKGIVKGERRTVYPIAMDDGGYAMAEYNYDGSYSIKHGDWSIALPDTVSVHGLAFDNATNGFYFIGLSDAGMWIGNVLRGDDSFTMVTRPTRSTMANLRAKDGKLYYNSIATGKDEAHMYDLAEGREYAITESKYGSFSPAPLGDGRVVMTTFSKDGYRLSVQDEGKVMKEVQWSKLPKNVVNPQRRKWNVINMDDVRVEDTTRYETRKYRKGLNLIQVHSWAPFYFDSFELIEGSEFNFGTGVTLLSQNQLNSTFSQLGYRYKQKEHYVSGKFRYYGWAPKFEVSAEWSTRDQYDYRAGLGTLDPAYRPGNYYNVKGLVYLPITLSSGYHVRRLTPQIEIEHNNARIISGGLKFRDGQFVYDKSGLRFRTGYQKLGAAIQFSDNVQMAYRDFQPRWGYMVGVSASGNPFNDMYSNLLEFFGRVYTPGFFPNHGIRLRGNIQHVIGEGLYGSRSDDYFPRGADYDRLNPGKYSGFSVDYQLPLCYPETGIPAVLYITRVRLSLGFDMAFWERDLRYAGLGIRDMRTWSFGGDIILDMIPIALPFNSQGSVRIGIYKPNDSGVQVGVGVSLPL